MRQPLACLLTVLPDFMFDADSRRGEKRAARGPRGEVEVRNSECGVRNSAFPIPHSPFRIRRDATLIGTALGFSLAFLLMAAAPAWAASSVLTVRIEGVISPVTDRVVGMALDRAKAEQAQALVIMLDTPGGLERSMRAIVQKMLNAELPVIVYVSPTGARAASARSGWAASWRNASQMERGW